MKRKTVTMGDLSMTPIAKEVLGNKTETVIRVQLKNGKDLDTRTTIAMIDKFVKRSETEHMLIMVRAMTITGMLTLKGLTQDHILRPDAEHYSGMTMGSAYSSKKIKDNKKFSEFKYIDITIVQ